MCIFDDNFCLLWVLYNKQTEFMPADLTNETYTHEHVMAVVRSHNVAIMSIAATYYVPGSFCFNAMVCDLTTYLWQVLASLPPGRNIDNEEAMVFTVLYRKAHKLSRDEKRHQSHLVYDVDLSNVAYDTDSDHLVNKMYYLIHHLDEKEQDMIALYLKYGNMMKMSKEMGVNYIKVVRLMSGIFDKLVQLNNTLGDDFDSDAMLDEAPTEETDNNDKLPTNDE